ncbi:glycoside hydrolase family 97 protein [Sphingobacterium corticibacterium]|uniref:Alpha-glucosidase n=1 Tax=Sphingobacterium corticibacterium TaxID=2484746 RepID=A0A4Q6XKY7_9SPHI|nr:glycoside hydrolase family 97 protein [Sphingobacterium corticibacterium]RZF57452.1 alpha-glucosidase [Sphingobacterium corticibacterium]
MKQLIFIIIFFISYARVGYAQSYTLESPDGNYQVEVYTANDTLWYSITYQNTPIILKSQLGVHAAESWSTELEIIGKQESAIDTWWKPVYGERSTVRDHYRFCEITIRKKQQPDGLLKLEFRAYNEGIAFRYVFPGGRYLQITEEFTEFQMPTNTHAYFTTRAQSMYEKLPLKDWPGESERPLILALDNGPYVLLTEAAVTDYVRSKFSLSDHQSNTIATSMYGPVDQIAPFKTPWRVVMAAEQPGEFIEHNDLLLNLNPSNEIDDPSWIKPGKAMREVTLTTEGAKSVVDFAVKRNMQYIMFDAGWYGPEGSKASDATTVTLDPARNPDPDALDLKAAIAYAKQHHIRVILYVNQRALFQQLDEILPLYKSWGVDGIKFGFVMVGSHYWTAWVHNAVRKCAEYGLVVDIHDEYRPTGFSRTYPNLLTQEGIYGNEEMPDATHNTTLPFTRYSQGAADYTICYYSNRIKTTRAHQLALSVIYYSPLQFLYWYDKPSDSQNEPELEFFDQVPTVWDDTKVLQGEIGKYITVARRSNEQWFLGTISNNDFRELRIPLDFLEKGKEYTAKIYKDDLDVQTRTKVGIKEITVNHSTILEANLLASGGQAIWIFPNE